MLSFLFVRDIVQRGQYRLCQPANHICMKTLTYVIVIAILFTACKKTTELTAYTDLNTPVESSFLPMHIGNYWKKGSASVIEITDTLRIGGQLYFRFRTRISDTYATQYLRIDEQNRLWEGYPLTPGTEYLHAKFDAAVGDTFYTLNDQGWNDHKVRMSVKTEHTRAFEFDKVYHPNLKGQLSTRTYTKGLGWSDDRWDSVRINGIVYLP